MTLFIHEQNGFSLKGFPTKITDITEGSYGFFQTELELKAFYDKRVEEYHRLIETQKKVIMYSIFMPTGKIMNRTRYGMFEGRQSWIPKRMQHKISSDGIPDLGFGFIISFRIVVRVDGKQTKYFDTDYMSDTLKMKSETHVKKEEFEIEWNEQREAFFKSMELQADIMTKKITEFLAKEEGELLQILDSGNVKLLN